MFNIICQLHAITNNATIIIKVCMGKIENHTLLIPNSDINFQTSLDGANAAFFCEIGSNCVSQAAACYKKTKTKT